MKLSIDTLYFYVLLCGICCGPVFTGYILGFSSPAIRDLTGVLSVMQISTFASMLYVGGVMGSVMIASVMDRWGRKTSISLSSVPAVLGWLLIVWCSSHGTNIFKYVHFLYFSRILGGVSCAMSMTATTVYLVEIAPVAWRGTVASLNQVGITVGIFLSFTIGQYLPYGRSAVVALIVTLVPMFCGLFAPESPRWLIKHDRLNTAKASLRRFRPQSANIDLELNEMMSSDNEISYKSQSPPVSLTTMFRGKYQSKTLVVVQLMLLQQFSGINAFISYADIIFVKILANYRLFQNFAMTIGLFQVIFTVLAMTIIDRFGRKSFLKVAGALMGFSLIVMTVSFKAEVGVLIIISMLTYIIGFSVGWGPIPVISSTEMLPQEARSQAGSIAVLTSWIGGYIVTSTFPFVNYMMGDGWVFIIFGIICIYAVVFVEKRVLETKGLALESIPD